MADHDLLDLYQEADQAPTFYVTTTEGGSTPQTMTGWTFKFVIRRTTDESSVFSTTSVATSSVNGTNDVATVTITETDITGWTPGTGYHGCLWRTDVDVPIWDGPVRLRRAASQ